MRASGEAGYPAGPRMTQEPEFAELRARWRCGFPQQATAGAGTARFASTLAEVHDDATGMPGFDASGMPGFTDPATLIPGANGPGANGPGANGPGANGPGANGPGLSGPGLSGPGLSGPAGARR